MNHTFASLARLLGTVLLTISFSAGFCHSARLPVVTDGATMDSAERERLLDTVALPDTCCSQTLNEYESLREQLQDTLADHVRLARWCQTHDLNDRRDAQPAAHLDA